MAARASSTCWWAIRCRASAERRDAATGDPTGLAADVAQRLLERNRVCEQFFAREAHRLAQACREMSERFLRGGRLLAFGRGPYATDAQHVSVEFVHPVIVGKRALPALDLSMRSSARGSRRSLHPEDIVMGFGPPEGDPEVSAALRDGRDARRHDLRAAGRAKATIAASRQPPDPFLHQEVIEILYHTLWETVHVFFEHRELGHDVGRRRLPLSVPRPGKAGRGRVDRGGGGFHPHEGRGRSPAARARGRESRPSEICERVRRHCRPRRRAAAS